MISLTSLTPAGAIGAVGGNVMKSIFGGKSSHQSSGLSSDFASELAGMFAALPQSNTSNATPTDPVSQITTLLQSGVSLTTIEDRLSSIISNAVQRAEPNATPAEIASIKASLMKSLASALSPPGTSPPGTAAQEATALAARLQQWIGAIAGEAGAAGQQNDISGQTLDATSAREIPAQLKKTPASSSLDTAGLARALLSAVATSLTQPTSSTSGSTAAPAVATASLLAQTPAQQTPVTPATAARTTPLPDRPTAVAPPVNNAPDLLARMLARAATVDARVNGNNPALTSAQAQAGTARANGGTALPGESDASNQSVLAARFANALSNLIATTSSSKSGDAGLSHDDGSAPDDQPASTSTTTPANPAISVVANAPVQAQTSVSAPAPQQTVNVDADAVVQQVVKGMMLRTTQPGTSQIQLRLVPESLGEVTMKITVQGSQISANVVAQSADVRSALMANHQQLARSLANSGLTLSGFSVDVSGGDAGKDNNRDRTGGFGRRYTVHELAASGEPETTDSSSIGPPLVSGSTLELLNYLA